MKMLGSKKINQERESHISRLQTNKCFCRHKILECVMCVLNCEISVCCCRCAISLKRIRAKLSISTSTSSDWKMVIRNIWSLEHSNNRSDRVCSSRKYASTMHNLGCCCSRDAVCEYFECFFSSFLMLFSCGNKESSIHVVFSLPTLAIDLKGNYAYFVKWLVCFCTDLFETGKKMTRIQGIDFQRERKN